MLFIEYIEHMLNIIKPKPIIVDNRVSYKKALINQVNEISFEVQQLQLLTAKEVLAKAKEMEAEKLKSGMKYVSSGLRSRILKRV